MSPHSKAVHEPSLLLQEGEDPSNGPHEVLIHRNPLTFPPGLSDGTTYGSRWQRHKSKALLAAMILKMGLCH